MRNVLRTLLCTLAMVPIATAADGTAVTFNRDVAPIIFASCTSCHRAGEVAPFPLQSYDDCATRGKQIASVVESRYMPPWKAEPGHGEFHGSRRLTEEQIKTIRKWVDGGKVEGDSKDLPPAPKFPDGWMLGTPDLVLKMPEPFTVPAEGRDVYRNFVIPTGVTEDKHVTAVEYRPSNRRVVHHAIFFLDNSGAARKKDAADKAPGFTSFGGPGFIPSGGLGGWAPGAFPRFLPDGTGQLLRKNADLVVQTHFHPTGKEEQEQSTIGIYFAKKTPEKTIVGLTLRNRNIDIPPGEKNYRISASQTLPVDTDLLGITPHAHLVCREMKATATLPDGSKKPLIWIKDWDFNWQEQYLYAKPLQLPAGTKLDMEYVYDNSDENIRNPSNPPKRVRHGEQTTDEMALLFLQAVPREVKDAGRLRMAALGGLMGNRAGAKTMRAAAAASCWKRCRSALTRTAMES
ncbi:MAG TPA: hypothetical protein VEJ63_18275 [Planctomycetota bacterium]|nr:hypothetical protein [Planctomycetota bacterium]